MTLDVKVMKNIDLIVLNPELSERAKQTRVYHLINRVVLPSDSVSSKQDYIKYALNAMRDYKVSSVVEPLDLFKKDI